MTIGPFGDGHSPSHSPSTSSTSRLRDTRRPLTRSVAHIISRATSTVKNIFHLPHQEINAGSEHPRRLRLKFLKLSINVHTIKPPHHSGGQGRVCVCPDNGPHFGADINRQAPLTNS